MHYQATAQNVFIASPSDVRRSLGRFGWLDFLGKRRMFLCIPKAVARANSRASSQAERNQPHSGQLGGLSAWSSK